MTVFKSLCFVFDENFILLRTKQSPVFEGNRVAREFDKPRLRKEKHPSREVEALTSISLTQEGATAWTLAPKSIVMGADAELGGPVS